LLDDDPLQALAYLAMADQHGAEGPAHDFAVAQAVRATDGELFVLTHDQIVGRARFSPDGKRIVTTGYDNRARIWNAATGAMISDLPHENPVLRIAFAPDGRFVTAGEAGMVKLWSADGKLLHDIAVSGGVQCVEFSPDGATLLTNTAVDEVRLWDVATGRSIAELRAGTENTFAMGMPCAISPDGTRIAAGRYGGPIDVWDARTRRPIATLTGHLQRLSTVRFSPDSQRLLTASQDDTAIVWRLTARTSELTLRHRDDVNSAMWSPDGTRIVTASNDHSAIVWDAATGRLVRSLTGHTEGVYLAMFSPDGNQIATVSDDATAQLWDADSGGRLSHRFGHSAPLRDVAFSPDGRRMATASMDGSAIVWTTEPALRTLPLRGHKGFVNSVAFSPDGRQVATGSYEESDARVWDVLTGRQLFALPGEADWVITAIQYSPDGAQIAATLAADGGGKVDLWNARTGQKIATLARGSKPLTGVAWAPSGTEIAAASEEGVVTVWATDGTLEREIVVERGDQLTGISFTQSGAEIAVTSASLTALLDAATGKERWRHENEVERWSLRLDHSGKRGLSATTERTAVIWGLTDGAAVASLVGHNNQVVSAAWSPDDTFIVTAAQDSTARVWDAATGDELAMFRQAQPLYAAAMSPSGDHFVATGSNGYAVLWDLPRYHGTEGQFERLLRCRVPWDITGERPVPRPRDLTACR
ncbi:MAG TPA: WD40 repeat domain-containing protein, partial [Kofleriaceae bacterium]|nr:WD40 repeat domain-containing protein [Kofleriaceae bacterium]